MERLLLILAAGLTLMLLAYVSLVHVEDQHQGTDFEALSAIVPDDHWYQEEVLNSPVPVLVDFTATWCGYCKQLAVILKDIEKEYGNRIRIVSVDVDDHPQVASALQVTGLPTLMVVKDKKIVAYEPGMMRYETIEKMIQPHLTRPAAPVLLPVPSEESAPGETSTILDATPLDVTMIPVSSQR